jgi:hypothetical protein
MKYQALCFIWILAVLGLTLSRAGAAAVDINYQAGLESLDQNQFKEGLDYLKKALKKDQKNPKIREMLGECYMGLGQNDDAIKSFIKCLDLDPNNAKAAKLLNQLLVAKQNPVMEIEKTEAPKKAGKIEFQLTGGFVSWTGSASGNVPWNSGQGMGVWLGYDFNSRVSLGARMNYFWYNTQAVNFQEHYLPITIFTAITNLSATPAPMVQVVQIIPTLKINFDMDQHRFEPYIFTGAGLMNESMNDTDIKGVTQGSTTDFGTVPGFSHNTFVGLIGLGLPLPLDKDVDLLFEVQEIFGFSETEPITYDSEDLGILFRL